LPVESEQHEDFEVWLDIKHRPFTILRVGTQGILLDFSRDYPHAIENSHWLPRQHVLAVRIRRQYSLAKITLQHDLPLLPKRIRMVASSAEPIVRSMLEHGYERVELEDSWTWIVGTRVTAFLAAMYHRFRASRHSQDR